MESIIKVILEPICTSKAFLDTKFHYNKNLLLDKINASVKQVNRNLTVLIRELVSLIIN